MYSNCSFKFESSGSSSYSTLPLLPDLNEMYASLPIYPEFHPLINTQFGSMDSSHQLNLNLTLSQSPYSYYNNPITDNLPINPPPPPLNISQPPPTPSLNNPISATSKPKLKRNRKKTTTVKERAAALQKLMPSPLCDQKMDITTTLGEVHKYIQFLQFHVNELEKLNSSVLQTSKVCVCCSEENDFIKNTAGTTNLSSSDATHEEINGGVTMSKSSSLN